MELTRAHGEQDVQVAAIGQAGENRVRYASIVTAGSVQAARMGVGAVMGSKHLKAVVLRGCTLPPVADPDRLAAIGRSFAERMPRNSLSMWQKNVPGFSAAADLADIDTAYIGMNNYKTNLSVGTSNYMREKYLPFYQGCIACPGCPNDCIKMINPRDGQPESAGIHQEVTGALGPNIGNDDLKLMLEGNVLCNQFGLDPVSLGFTISFALECLENGLISPDQVADCPIAFGQTENLLGLIKNIALRRGIGDLLAEGSRLAAEHLGPAARPFALQVKGIEMVSFEPRTQANLALGYATAPIGPRYDICEHDWDFDTVTGWDHTLELSRTLGIFERVPMEAISEIKVRHYKVLNTIWSACDVLDLCVFASAPTRLLTLSDMVGLVESITGWKSSDYELMRWGERRNHLMRLYNLRQGLGASDDTLPDRFFTEPIAFGRLAGTLLDREAFQAAITLYYEMMGWDEQGVPRRSTLIDYGLA
jgi:aldehyde:ferredoxin oxidoreductase